MSSRIGTYVEGNLTGETYKAYIPTYLPPNPPLEMEELYKPLEQTMKALRE